QQVPAHPRQSGVTRARPGRGGVRIQLPGTALERRRHCVVVPLPGLAGLSPPPLPPPPSPLRPNPPPRPPKPPTPCTTLLAVTVPSLFVAPRTTIAWPVLRSLIDTDLSTMTAVLPVVFTVLVVPSASVTVIVDPEMLWTVPAAKVLGSGRVKLGLLGGAALLPFPFPLPARRPPPPAPGPPKAAFMMPVSVMRAAVRAVVPLGVPMAVTRSPVL